jgi:membrane-anchored protein YejM (alkaline phosphatase superfamily)
MPLGSAELLTDYTHSRAGTPDNFQIGLGTTIVADIYLAFGLVGILLLMYFMGYMVNRWLVKSRQLNYYSIIILCAVLGNSIFLVRAGYFHAFRFMVWAVVLASINILLQRKWRR